MLSQPACLGYIYALIDPFTREIRYIGSSKEPRRRFLNHHAAALRHYRLRSLGRTKYNQSPGYRRQRFLNRAFYDWLYGLQQKGVRARLLILDTCVNAQRERQTIEACYIRDYARITRLFNTACPSTVEGFGCYEDLLHIPPRQRLLGSFVPDPVPAPRIPLVLTRCEYRWLQSDKKRYERRRA